MIKRLEEVDTISKKALLKKAIKSTIQAGLIIAVLFAIGYGLSKAEEKRARAECTGWQEDAKKFPAFYLTEGEAMQCDAVGVAVF